MEKDCVNRWCLATYCKGHDRSTSQPCRWCARSAICSVFAIIVQHTLADHKLTKRGIEGFTIIVLLGASVATLVAAARHVPGLKVVAISVLVCDILCRLWRELVEELPVLGDVEREQVDGRVLDREELGDVVRADVDFLVMLLDAFDPLRLDDTLRVRHNVLPYHPRDVHLEVGVCRQHVVDHLVVLRLRASPRDAGVDPSESERRVPLEHVLNLVLIERAVRGIADAAGVVVHEDRQVGLDAKLPNTIKAAVVDPRDLLAH
mmetsp:Transcript_20551/g.41773  ORF Transcript_20551/g.41773 Transcript_20551/m.41773 type:complete len:262 (-) Transcript_20551:565-1350(-)